MQYDTKLGCMDFTTHLRDINGEENRAEAATLPQTTTEVDRVSSDAVDLAGDIVTLVETLD